VRRVEVGFRAPVDPARYAAAGVGPVEVAGLVHRFSLRGEPGRLLAALAGLPVADVVIERARLEDVVRALYDEGAGEEAAA